MRTSITPWQRPWIPQLAACLALLASGCTTPWGTLGAVGEEGSTTDDPTMGDTGETDDGGQTSNGHTGVETAGETGDEPPTACELDVGSSHPRALVRTQYENTVADVLGLPAASWSTDALWDELPSGGGVSAGPFEAVPLVQGEAAVSDAYQAMAAAVALALDPATLLPCDPATPDPGACAEDLVTALGRQLWRRPLEPAEVEALLQGYEGTDLVEGTRALVNALLASPNAWVLQETGAPWATDPAVIELDSWSMATRMSYFVWGSAPDDELLAQAEAGTLSDPTVRAAQVDRMLADPRAERLLGQLYRDWLDVELDAAAKDPALFPEYGPELAAAMEHELYLFVTNVVLHGDGRLHTLLNAPFTYVDSQLAALYGSDVLGDPGVLAPGEFVRVDLDPARRGGVLTLPAVMAQHSEPARLPWDLRGLLVRQNLLCQVLPPPPPDVDNTPVHAPGTRYEAWQATVGEEPACMACHQLFDPLTFAFDEYDPIGRFQTDIEGEPVQTAGELLVLVGDPLPFSGRADLTQILGALPDVSECAAGQHVSFALRRGLDDRDMCAVETLAEQLQASDGDLRVLLRDVVASEHFELVRPE